MLTFENLFSSHQQQKEERFISTNIQLQDTYISLINEANRLAIEAQEGNKIAAEYHLVYLEKIKQFEAKYPSAEKWYNSNLRRK